MTKFSWISITIGIICLISLLFTGYTRADQKHETHSASAPIYSNLIVGVPGEDIAYKPSPIQNAGMVHQVNGAPAGLGYSGNQIYHQNGNLSNDQAESEDQFGNSLATGDFNGDGIYDLAVGVPFEDISSGFTQVINAGAVHVMYGSDTGELSFYGDQFWHQGSPGIEGSVEYDDQFGKALAAGDFNGDDYDDLAIGIPFEDFEYTSMISNAGSVTVIYGSSSGLHASAVLADQMWNQDSAGVIDNVEAYDWFGWALAVGDFDDDEYDDLAIGAPGEDSEAASKDDVGVVHVIYGSAIGLTADRDQQWEQYDWGGSAESESQDHFGWSLAVGDFKTIGYDDLAIGVPDEDIEGASTVTDAGAVNILYGSASGLDDSLVDFLYQDGAYIEETAEYQDRFGYSLAAVKFRGSSTDDLVVGVPYENLGDPVVVDAGAVHVIIYMFSTGWMGSEGRTFHQGSEYIPDELETGDTFGYVLAPGDYNNDGKEDLAIGVPYDSCNAVEDGSVVVIYTDFISDLEIPHQRLCQGDGLVDQGETGDHFGLALVAIPKFETSPFSTYLPVGMKNH